MRSTMNYVLVVSLLMLAGTSCGGDADGDDGGDDLSCASIALCTTYDVKTFITNIPEPTGGTLSNGLYRLAHVLHPDRTDSEDGYYGNYVSVLRIQDGQFERADLTSGRGDFTTTNNELFLHYKRSCDLGEEGPQSGDDFIINFPYTANANQIQLYNSAADNDGNFKIIYVYVKSTADEVCETVSVDPESPGNSAQCNATDCGCVFALDDTIDSNSCPTF